LGILNACNVHRGLDGAADWLPKIPRRIDARARCNEV
jgi:hypothetical protein